MDAQIDSPITSSSLESLSYHAEMQSVAAERLAANHHRHNDCHFEASRLLDDVRLALDTDFAAATKFAALLAALLANNCSNSLNSVPARGGLAPWQKRKVQQHIEGNLDEALPVELLAKLVSLSPSYFCRAFKETFGGPPHTYIIKKRVERAQVLMLNTSEGLSQIALACGLADQAHLCRCFRQVAGTTPGIWRRNHAEDPTATADPPASPIRGQGEAF